MRGREQHLNFREDNQHPWMIHFGIQSLCPTLLQPRGLQPVRVLCPWDFPGKNMRVGCHFLLQGSFLTRELNPDLQHCGWILYHGATREASKLTCIWGIYKTAQMNLLPGQEERHGCRERTSGLFYPTSLQQTRLIYSLLSLICCLLSP